MYPFRKKLFHIVTICLFVGLLIHSWSNQDILAWACLFLLIIFNALLFIVSRPITMISWITILIGILGIIMSIPDLVSTGVGYLNGESGDRISGLKTCRSAGYFALSTVFSYLQIHRTFR